MPRTNNKKGSAPKLRLPLIGALGVCAPLLLLTACDTDSPQETINKIIEKRIEKATGNKADVNLDDEGLTLSTEGRTLKLTAADSGPVEQTQPPDYFPLPPGARIESFVEGIASETLTFTLPRRNVTDATTDIAALLESKGFQEKRLFLAEGMVTARYISRSGAGSMQLAGHEEPTDGSLTTIATLIFIPTTQK